MGQQSLSHIAEPADQIGGYDTLVKDAADGHRKLSLLVTGAHCAACIHKIETAIRHNPDVSFVRLNFSTGQLSVEWTGPREAANDFAASVKNLGYGVRPYEIGGEKAAMDAEERFLLLCLGVAAFSMGNIMLVSVGLWTTDSQTMGVATRDFMHWISALIALPTILYSGRPFFRSAWSALKSGRTNMDVPISVGLILTGTMSMVETINHGEHAYFDSAVMLIFFLLIGRYFDFRARKKAQSSAAALLSSMAGFATVIEDGKPRHILIRDITEGQIVRVAVGEKFPVDGDVIEGISDVDMSLVTGETIPVTVTAGSQIYAGTVNQSAPILLKVTKRLENSLLADIARLLEKATQAQAYYVRIADRAAKYYTPVVHLLALFTFIAWWGFLDTQWQSSLLIAITVLIITCPCALGLAVPVVQVLATNKLMRHGILVKSGDALERLAAMDYVLMDKTGTLTMGKPVLVGSEVSPDNLRVAASLAAFSCHPLSRALASAYSGELLPAENVKEYPGQGMEAQIDGRTVRLGSRAWCGRPEAEKSEYLELWINIEGNVCMPFFFIDQLRTDSRETIEKFRKDDLALGLLSGDREEVVRRVASDCALETYQAEQTPQMKLAFLEALKRQHKVLMIGDGLNDAPTLAAANVSMAPASAIAITQNAADIVFTGDKFGSVYAAYRTARFTQKLVRQNFILAIIYNVIAIPIAAMGFLTPLIAALAMSGSSLVVIINSFRIVRDK